VRVCPWGAGAADGASGGALSGGGGGGGVLLGPTHPVLSLRSVLSRSRTRPSAV
jgi:galactokinase/mevalonate kinase-like predicted kinase